MKRFDLQLPSKLRIFFHYQIFILNSKVTENEYIITHLIIIILATATQFLFVNQKKKKLD